MAKQADHHHHHHHLLFFLQEVNVSTSCASKEGVHSPRWPNGLIVILIIILIIPIEQSL
jgi:hypothetical protein